MKSDLKNDWKDFLNIAEAMYQNREKCADEFNCSEISILRTAVSRAYFSLYLSCRLFAATYYTFNIENEKKEELENYWIKTIAVNGPKDGRELVGNWLKVYRKARNRADYKNIDIKRLPNDAYKSVKYSKVVINEIIPRMEEERSH